MESSYDILAIGKQQARTVFSTISFSIAEKISSLPVHLLKKQVALLIIVFSGCMWILLQTDFNRTTILFKFDKYSYVHPGNSTSGFLIDTKGCRILDLDPFDPELSQYFVDDKPIDCDPEKKGSLVKAINNELMVDHTVIKNYANGLFTCCYTPFKRKEAPVNTNGNLAYRQDVDEQIQYSEFCYEFTDSVTVQDEFVKVVCTTDEGKPIYKEFFSFAQNPYIKEDARYNNGVNSDKLSVLIVGFDGMSRLNFIRQMPRTYKFLEEEESVSLQGYNKVGYNTFPNVVPVLTGLGESELKKTCWKHQNHVFDNCTFIWDRYKNAGYVTSYGEDAPTMGTFYFVKRGFRKKPVDYYPRPLIFQAERELGNHLRLNVKLCTGNKLSSRKFNGLIETFARNLKNQLSFGFFWGNSLSHDYLNLPRIGDEDFRSVLNTLKSERILNRTLLILMSDHGIRWGEFRTTYQGFLEEKLPFVFFLFPKWFKQKHSTALANLKTNGRRLTSPYDVHETLMDLLNNEQISDENIRKRLKRPKGKIGRSLFEPISGDRTCKEAGVPDEWCACHTNKALPTNTEESKNAAASVVHQINNLLKGYRQCSVLKISKLVSARIEEVPNKESLKYSFKDYIVTLETIPGRGLFEATVRHKADSGFTVLGSISRLNMYGNQSSCISDYALKLYCFCNAQWQLWS